MRKSASETLRNIESRVARLEKSSGRKFSRATQIDILKTFIKLCKGRGVKIEGDASLDDFDANENPIYKDFTIKITFNIEELHSHISPIIQKNENAKISEKKMVDVLYKSTSRSGMWATLVGLLFERGLLNPLKIRGFYWESGKPSNFNPRSLRVVEMEWFLHKTSTELELRIPLVVS